MNCKWHWKGTPNGIIWLTQCGRYSSTFSPIFEKFEYCPYCGKPLEIIKNTIEKEELK